MIAKLHALPSDLPHRFLPRVLPGFVLPFFLVSFDLIDSCVQSVMKSYNCAEFLSDYHTTKSPSFGWEIALLLAVFLFLPVSNPVIWLAANETCWMNWNAMWYLMPGLSHGLASRKSGRQRWAGSLRHWLLCNNELPVTIPPRHSLVFYHPFLFDRSMNWVGLTSCLLSSSRLEKEWDEQSNLCRRILIKNHKMRWATQHGVCLVPTKFPNFPSHLISHRNIKYSK